MTHPTRVAILLAAMAFLSVPVFGAQELTFDERVEAQARIESVYYFHQIGTTRPFEEAVSRETLELRVRLYLDQSLALEQLWHTEITETMLERELERIVAGTRFPERVEEIYAALDRDPVLVLETFVRQALVARLAARFFETGPGANDLSWDAWWAQVEDRIDPGQPLTLELATSILPDPGRVSGTGTETIADCPTPDAWINGILDDAFPPPSTANISVWTGSLMLVVGNFGLQDGGYRYDPLIDSWSRMSTVDAPLTTLPSIAVWTGSEAIFGLGLYGGLYDPLTDTWRSMNEHGIPPGAHLADPTAIWTGSEMIVWGGNIQGAVPPRQDAGYAYDPETDEWRDISTVGVPSRRFNHTAVWTGTEMLIWGGDIEPETSDVGGRYDPSLDSWSPMSGTGDPDPNRIDHTAVWVGDRMVVWGGWTSGITADGGVYDPTMDTWTATGPTDAPEARWKHTAVAIGNRMVVWGGLGAGGVLGNGGRYDPQSDTWDAVSLTGAPSARVEHSAVSAGSTMIVWAGDTNYPDSGGWTDTGGRYDPATDIWTPTATRPGPSPRWGATAVWTGNEMIVWGGSGTRSNQGGRYDAVTDSWSPTNLVGSPASRFYHTAVWTGTEMVVWGGIGTGPPFRSGGRYDPVGDTWAPTSTVDAPEARGDHTAVWTGSEMIVWGGSADPLGFANYLGTGGRYDPVLDTWTATSTDPLIRPVRQHTAVWTGDEMIVWGGKYFDAGIQSWDGGGIYEPVTDTWMTVPTDEAPAGRYNHTAVWTGDQMIVWGGELADGGGRYAPATGMWADLPSTDEPAAMTQHTAVWTGSEMIVWGSSGGRYAPATDTWSGISEVDQPAPREKHAAVWTGEGMIVWGGISDSPGTLGDGGRYLADRDLDGWMPACDNCPDRFNPGQEDADTDGVGDACDACTDTDSDGYGNPGFGATTCPLDNCPMISNPMQEDGDLDGAGDVCDCAPADRGAFAIPAEVTGLRMAADCETLFWEPAWPLAGEDTVHDLIRGDLAFGLPVGSSTETCVAPGTSAAEANDPTEPTPGAGLWYLIRARNVCGTGSYGFAPEGTERISATCP